MSSVTKRNMSDTTKSNKRIKTSPKKTIQPVTKRFNMEKSTIQELKKLIPEFGFNGLGEVVFRRTYSRGNENWADVVIRVVEGAMSIRKEHFFRNTLRWEDSEWQSFAKEMAFSLFKMEWLPPGRGLWMMGTQFANERGSMALNNCGAIDTEKDIVLAADWAMDGLMNGVGIGFSTKWRGEAKLPNKEDKELFVIPDSREGWIESLIKLMCAYIDSPRYGTNKFPVFDYSVIRKAGLPIKGFGGMSSGSEPLEKLHNRVTTFLDAMATGRLQATAKTWKEFKIADGKSEWKEVEITVDREYSHTRFVADVFNSIGACVVAGNVRRCLPAYAMVHTDKGLVPIRDVKIGDRVMTMEGYEHVTNHFYQGEQKLVRIIMKDREFKCTPNHRMAVFISSDEYTWKQASELKFGDQLISSSCHIDGSHIKLPVKVLEVISDQVEQTYDIEVENRHEFFCNSLLTHNSAEICLGDVEDKDFINLKNYDLYPERSELGWMSNNSVVLRADQNYEDFSFIPDLARRICDNGEPGIINLYNIQKYGRIGKEMSDDATMVNPCFSGDTLIAVADGRGCVRIDQLEKEGKDVPVYSINEVSGEVSIQWGRHPRVTGTNKKLLRIHFDGNNKDEYIDVTPNHKFLLNDGRTVEARELGKGDSLPQFKKAPNGKDDYIVVHTNGQRKTEHRMIKEFYEPEEFYKTYSEGVHNGCCRTHNVVIHHKDDTKRNNHPDNLEITTAGDHNRIHNLEYVGKGNLMYGRKHTTKTKRLIAQKVRERCHDPAYRQKLRDTQTPEQKEISRRTMTKMRAKKTKERYDKAELNSSGLSMIRVSDTELKVVKTCENEKCILKFIVDWCQRERSFCSLACANTKKESIEARKNGQQKSIEAKATFHKQAMIYKDLCEEMQIVEKKDFESACKKQGVSYRFNAKSTNPWIADGWRHFKQMVDIHNHRVSWVEDLDGKHKVYNITVDNNHTLAVVTKMNHDFSSLSGVFTKQCGEIPLNSGELCNLAETFPPRCANVERFYQALKFATFYTSAVSLLPTHRPETNAIVSKNRRVGVSISGIAQWASGVVPDGWGHMDYTKMGVFLRKGYKIVRTENSRLADEAGVPASIRVTTVKPSGSISLLAGVTPGVHYPVSRFAIRRMRIGNDSPLVPALKAAGIPWEVDRASDNTLVFEFTIDHGEVRQCEEVSPWEQFSLVQMMQKHYSDNCVSATIYFDKEKDGPDVEKMLAMFIPNLKSVSMLPHAGHGYDQAPYEPITKEEYEKRKNAYQLPDFGEVKGNVPIGSKFCTGGMCSR